MFIKKKEKEKKKIVLGQKRKGNKLSAQMGTA